MIESSASITYNEYSKILNEYYNCSYCGNKLKGIQSCNCKGNPLNMTLNGKDIKSKDVPEHRLINARKIAVNSSVHDYRKAEKPQLPKKDDNMWKSIKKFAVKRLLPDIKEIINGDLYANIDDGVLTYGGFVEIFGEIVWEVEYSREL